MVLINSELKYW